MPTPINQQKPTLGLPEDPQFEKDLMPMVGWYDPKQLWQTAKQVVISTIIGRHSDRRLMEDVAANAHFYEFSGDGQFAGLQSPNQPKTPTTSGVPEYAACELLQARQFNLASTEDIWIDYVSDVGDGWNSTYAVAHYLSQKSLQLGGKNLKRGEILIFGGDEVYPTADHEEYRKRLVYPYSYADCQKPEKPNLPPYAFAIPGNHDWYDSLASFTDLFSARGVRQFGHWHIPQDRSYFALKLPRNWWLLGVDVQLDHNLDMPQLSYFKAVQEQMTKDDRVILCCAEPFWVFNEIDSEYRERYENSRLRQLIDDLFGQKIKVCLAGDLHHYYRATETDGTLKITAGGGGAFLHPTHGDVTKAYDPNNSCSYPDKKQSWWLCIKNLWFLKNNPWYGAVTAPLYLMLVWFMLAGIGEQGRARLIEASKNAPSVVNAAWNGAKTAWSSTWFDNPFLVFLVLAAVAGFIGFADGRNKASKFFAGFLHASAHLAVAPFIGWLVYLLYVGKLRSLPSSYGCASSACNLIPLIGSGGLIAVAGFLIGPCIMGLYLLISLNLYGRHMNEAFSSLQIEGWKNFLRMKIDTTGNLTIYPIGIKDVPSWKKGEWKTNSPTENNPSAFVPVDPDKFKPVLIEENGLSYPPK
ncbi:MAG: hypothetical protein ACKVZH_24965 [Blastocatellia bacterium]